MARENITEYDGFPARLREVRKRRGITAVALSERCGLSKNMVYRYEKGKRKPNSDNIRALCTELKVSADYLLGLID